MAPKQKPFIFEEKLCELREKVKLSLPKEKIYKLDEIAL